MGSFSIWHWLIVLAVVLLLFGAGKIPRLMGDMAKGVKAFKQGMKDEDDEPAAGTDKKSIDSNSAQSVNAPEKDSAAKH